MNNTKYAPLPKAVYYQCMWVIKDMERLRKLEALKAYEQMPEEYVFFTDETDTMTDASVIDNAVMIMACIRDAAESIPEEYREDTISGIIYGLKMKDKAHENTWRKWRARFLNQLARNLKLI